MKNFILITTLVLSSITFAEWKEIGNEDNIKILSLPAQNGVLPFKAIGNVENNIEEIVTILKDHKLKPKWAPKLESVKVHEQLGKEEFVFSEYYKTPWPATDREFLLKGEVLRPNESTVILKAFSVDETKQYKNLKSEDHVQASVKYINLKLTKLDATNTQIEFEFHGDMKGWMPNWLMNLIQKKWPLRFIQGLRKQSGQPKKLVGLKS